MGFTLSKRSFYSCCALHLFCFCSLPHDQDCHELWSKRRKKSLREQKADLTGMVKDQHKDVQPVMDEKAVKSRATVAGLNLEPLSSGSGGLTHNSNKSDVSGSSSSLYHHSSHSKIDNLGNGQGKSGSVAKISDVFSFKRDTAKIPGLDFGDDGEGGIGGQGISKKSVKGIKDTKGQAGGDVSSQASKAKSSASNVSELQRQLTMLTSLLQASGSMSLAQLASKNNMAMDQETKRLLENINLQLMLASTVQQLQQKQKEARPDAKLDGKNLMKSNLLGVGSTQTAQVREALTMLLNQQGINMPSSSQNRGSAACHQGADASVQSESAGRKPVVSQQASHGSAMSLVSDDSSISYLAEQDDSQRAAPRPLTSDIRPIAETMSLKSKMQNFFESQGRETPLTPGGSENVLRKGMSSRDGRISDHSSTPSRSCWK